MQELIADFKDLTDFCKERGIHRFKWGVFEAEFFPPTPQPMALDPVSLSKALSDSLPPDSAMLFASSEDMNETPISEQRETDAMT